MSALSYVNENGVARITLNNPPQNRLSADLMEAFGAAIMDMSQRTDTRVLLVKAEGPDFSFGGDITPWLDTTGAEFTERMTMGIALSNMLEDLPFPTISAIQGHCRGGGFELALRTDIMVAADNAQFGHPEATIGVFTFLGGVQRVAERVGKTRAIQWAYTAEMIGAEKALSIGLINDVVPLDRLSDTAEDWVDKLINGPTRAHAVHKKLLREWSNSGIKAADEIIPPLAGEILESEDAQGALGLAIPAFKAGQPRPEYPFQGK